MGLDVSPVSNQVAPMGAPAAGASGLLRLGARGPEVESLQRELNQLGENIPVNGQFGPRTLEAVKRFQRATGLVPADGVVRPNVAAALARAGQAVERGGWSAAPRASAPAAVPAQMSARDLQNKEASAVRSADSQFLRGSRGWELEKKRGTTGLAPAENTELNAARSDPKQSKVVPGPVTRAEQWASQEVAQLGAHFKPEVKADPDAEMLKTDPLAMSVFNKTDGWTQVRNDDKFAQRMQVRNGHMYTETRAAMNAPVDKVVEQLRGPWSWWQHGSQTNRVELANGDVSYELKPTGFGIDVNETMHKPEKLPDGGVRIQIDMKGPSVFGKAYFEIHPDGPGKSVVSGRFAGATTPSSPLQPSLGGMIAGGMGPETVAKNHLLAEGGQLPWTLGKPGTGWVGLGDKLGWGGKP